MAAPKGNRNAKGNKGGHGVSLNDRVLAAEVRRLALSDIKKVLEEPEMTPFKVQVLLKLAPSILPRLNEHTGEGGEPIEQRIIYLPQRNEPMEAARGKAD